MGAGIARIIAKLFPEAKEADDETISGDVEKMGEFTFSVSNYNDNLFYIFNMYSQLGIGSNGTISGRNTRYDDMVNALNKIKKFIESMIDDDNKPILGIPYGLGSDLAGGSWTIVRAIIESVLGDAEFDVVICRLPDSKELK